VSSYLLVAYEHQEPANRRAALLYLLMAQVGALLILLAFGVLSGFDGQFHVRRAARQGTRRAVAHHRVRAGADRFRHESRPGAPARMAARGPPGGAFAHIRAECPRDAEDRGLRVRPFHLRPARRAVVDLGRGDPRRGQRDRAVRGALRPDAARSQAAARLPLVENIGIIYIGLGLAAIFFGAGHPALGPSAWWPRSTTR